MPTTDTTSPTSVPNCECSDLLAAKQQTSRKAADYKYGLRITSMWIILLSDMSVCILSTSAGSDDYEYPAAKDCHNKGEVIMKKEIMVKVCSRCGIVNAEKAEECESCGAGLGAAVTNSAAKKLSKQIARNNEKMRKAIADEKFGGLGEKVPDIPVTTSRIIIGSIGILAAIGLIALMVIGNLSDHEFAPELNTIGVCGLLLIVIAVLYCFLPGPMWAFEHAFYHLHYKEMPEPSGTGLVLQQVSCVILILLGAAAFVFQLCVLTGVL